MKVVEKPNFKIAGIGIITTVQKCSQDLKPGWDKFMSRISEINQVDPSKVLGFCKATDKDDCSFKYIACAEVAEEFIAPEGMEITEVPKSKYLVFTHKGPIEKIGETYGEIQMCGVPKSNMKQNGLWLEVYPHNYDPSSNDSEMEILVGVN
ncbi:AraC family transcriptional regulator [Candidatus Woesearchaeota archaeon]|jgi:AraC family transcriptional regulator|nr:AraC family transcriptional regulator [Candidatus Woesearchaeota archaeon]